MDAKRKKQLVIGAAIAGGGVLLVLYLRAQAGASSSSGGGSPSVPIYGGLGPNFSSGGASFAGSPIGQQANGGESNPPTLTETPPAPRPSRSPVGFPGGHHPGPDPRTDGGPFGGGPVPPAPVASPGQMYLETALYKLGINPLITHLPPRDDISPPAPDTSGATNPLIQPRVNPIQPRINAIVPAGASLYGNQVQGSSVPEPAGPSMR